MTLKYIYYTNYIYTLCLYKSHSQGYSIPHLKFCIIKYWTDIRFGLVWFGGVKTQKLMKWTNSGNKLYYFDI